MCFTWIPCLKTHRTPPFSSMFYGCIVYVITIAPMKNACPCSRAFEGPPHPKITRKTEILSVLFQHKYGNTKHYQKFTKMDEFGAQPCFSGVGPFCQLGALVPRVRSVLVKLVRWQHICGRGLPTWCTGNKGAVGVCQVGAVAFLFACLSACLLLFWRRSRFLHRTWQKKR